MKDLLNEPKGGSEIVYNTIKTFLPEYFDKINLIVSRVDEDAICNERINVLLQQLDVNQPAVQNITNPEYYNELDHIVFVSNWQYERYRNKFNINGEKVAVIKNATHSCDKTIEKPREKIKLIYTSTPWRGLNVLLEVFKRIYNPNIELDLFTSTIIYGKQFYHENDDDFKRLYEYANSIPGVNLHGYATNDVILNALDKAHIFAYPSTFQETSCISAIEAAMHGCLPVVTNYGALYETLAEWGSYVNIDNDFNRLVERYATKLQHEIDNYWSEKTQKQLYNQKIYFDKFYSWDVRIQEWETLFKRLINAKR